MRQIWQRKTLERKAIKSKYISHSNFAYPSQFAIRKPFSDPIIPDMSLKVSNPSYFSRNAPPTTNLNEWPTIQLANANKRRNAYAYGFSLMSIFGSRSDLENSAYKCEMRQHDPRRLGAKTIQLKISSRFERHCQLDVHRWPITSHRPTTGLWLILFNEFEIAWLFLLSLPICLCHSRIFPSSTIQHRFFAVVDLIGNRITLLVARLGFRPRGWT